MRHRKTRQFANKIAFSTLLFLWAAVGLSSSVAAQIECGTPDQTEITTNYSLYYEDFKNESYTTAMPYLRWILECAPGYPGNTDRNFKRLLEAYEGLAKQAEGTELKRVYMDSVLYTFDSAPAKMQDAGIEVDPLRWKFDKARFIQQNTEIFPDLQADVGFMYLDIYNENRTLLQNYYLNYIIVHLISQDMKAEAIEFMDRVEQDYPGDAELTQYIESYRGQLFTSPEERIEYLESQIAKNPDDPELSRELFQIFVQEGMRDRVYEMAQTMMQIDRTATTYRMIAKMRLDDGDTQEAIRLYEESVDLPGGDTGVKEVYYNIGLAHQQNGRLANARTFYRRALDADPNYAQALIAIGDLYVSAVQGCSTFERQDRAVYWLAADYFDRAASRAENETLQNQGRQRSSSIREYFPTEEHKFFSSWSTGDRYTVNYGCYSWINESTTVR